MKNKYLNLLWILVASLTLSFASCSSEDDPITDDKTSELVISDTNVRVLVGETSTLEITQGGGEYKAFSLNEDIATVEITNNKLAIDTYTNGRTSIVISDKNSNYKTVEVVSYYGEILLEESNVVMKMRIGNQGTKRIKVLGGNGGYVATSEDSDIASVSVDGDYIIVTGKTEGEVKIHIVDQLDVETDFSVTIETTSKAYEGEELEEILQDTKNRFYFDGEVEYSYGSPYATVENGYNVYGWDYYGFYYQKVYFKGDKTVGVKEDAKYSQAYGTTYRDVPIDFEIVKNDGTMFWAIFSFIQNEKLHYGYFVRPI